MSKVRIRPLREVVARHKLTVDAMQAAGVGRNQAVSTWAAVHTPERLAAAASREALVRKLRSGGLTAAEVRQTVAGKLAARVGIGGGPSGPTTLKVVVPPPPPPPPPKAAARRPEDDLRAAVLSAPRLSARLQAASDWVAANRANTPAPQLRHGMTTAEVMDRVNWDGLPIHFPATPDGLKSAAFTLLDWVDNRPLPARLLSATRAVYLSSRANRHDALWAEKYGMPGFVSPATGGDGDIVAYNGYSVRGRTLAHESGHNLATQLYGSTEPGGDFAAAAAGEPPPTAYAAKAPAEDFAESWAEYWNNPESLRRTNPRRYAVIDRLAKDPDDGG